MKKKLKKLGDRKTLWFKVLRKAQAQAEHD